MHILLPRHHDIATKLANMIVDYFWVVVWMHGQYTVLVRNSMNLSHEAQELHLCRDFFPVRLLVIPIAMIIVTSVAITITENNNISIVRRRSSVRLAGHPEEIPSDRLPIYLSLNKQRTKYQKVTIN